MKSYLILFPIFFLAVLQGAFLPVNLVLLLVLIWSATRPEKESFLTAFLAGIFLDLAQGTPLGLSSLIFLAVISLLLLYSRRFESLHPLFLFLFTFLASVVYALVLDQPWLGRSLILASLVLVASPLVKYFAEPTSKGIKLKL